MQLGHPTSQIETTGGSAGPLHPRPSSRGSAGFGRAPQPLSSQCCPVKPPPRPHVLGRSGAQRLGCAIRALPACSQSVSAYKLRFSSFSRRRGERMDLPDPEPYECRPLGSPTDTRDTDRPSPLPHSLVFFFFFFPFQGLRWRRYPAERFSVPISKPGRQRGRLFSDKKGSRHPFQRS